MFFNGPAANPFNNARISLYGVGATPTVKMDGLSAAYSPSTYANTINNRLADPCYVEIEVSMAGDSTGGTAYISVTAEQELGVTGLTKVWCAIIEDDQLASGSTWGGYNGKTLDWLPVAWPMGATGTVITFTGPYPQTISISHAYTLNPAVHTFENLRVVTFVQPTGGTKEVLNAHYMDLPDATGIEEPDDPGSGAGSGFDLSVWPNPCSGQLGIGVLMPESVSGTISVYDITGREVASFEAQAVNTIELTDSGVYFARLSASTGITLSERFTVIR